MSEVNTHEHLYKNMNLSDLDVVKYLLKNRYNIDKYYKENSDHHYNNAGVTGDINQELISLLTSLDILLSRISITDKQREVLSLIEKGFTYSDIGKMTNRKRHTILEIFNNLSERIVKESNKRWRETMRGRIKSEQ